MAVVAVVVAVAMVVVAVVVVTVVIVGASNILSNGPEVVTLDAVGARWALVWHLSTELHCDVAIWWLWWWWWWLMTVLVTLAMIIMALVVMALVMEGISVR